MCANQASSMSECCAPVPTPAPVAVRMVSGTAVWPPDMKRSFAAWLTIWSMATVMKFISMISATGRMPAIAAPIAAPTMACSEIGVARTRLVPYFVDSPLVHLEDAAALARRPMSSPRRMTLGSVGHAPRSSARCTA